MLTLIPPLTASTVRRHTRRSRQCATRLQRSRHAQSHALSTAPSPALAPALSLELQAQLAQAQEAAKQLAKLPILGPALWLYAKDVEKKYLFLADTGSASAPARILSPVILEQCQLFTKGDIPFAFITWAPLSVMRSDAVDARLRSGVPALAPHEWKGGAHAWLIDVISPFEKADGYVAACCGKFMAGKKVSRLVAGKESVRVEEVVGG